MGGRKEEGGVEADKKVTERGFEEGGLKADKEVT